jgi:hypothetical protein
MAGSADTLTRWPGALTASTPCRLPIIVACNRDAAAARADDDRAGTQELFDHL